MGYFDEQVKRKKELEEEMFSDAYNNLVSVVVGDGFWRNFSNDSEITRNAIRNIARLLKVKIPDVELKEKTVKEYLEDYFRPQGIMWRPVKLSENWHKDVYGIMLGTTKDGKNTVIIPCGASGYAYTDPDSGKKIRINNKTAKNINPEALLLYRCLPQRKIDRKDVRHFIFSHLSAKDVAVFAAATLIVVLLGMFIPAMTNIMLSDVIPALDTMVFYSIILLLIIAVLATFVFTIVKSLVLSVITVKTTIPLQAAFMMRALTAPTDVINSFSAGDLGQRIGSIFTNVKLLTEMFLSIILTAVCSLICIVQMFIFSSELALFTSGVIVILILIYIYVIRTLYKVSTERMVYQAEDSGITYGMIAGINKIILSGAQKRSFVRWASSYKNAVRTIYNPPFIIKIYSVLTPVILLGTTIVIYIMAFNLKIETSNFYAFMASFGIVTASFENVALNLEKFGNTLPIFEILKPIMDMVPEVQQNKEIVEKLHGDIMLNRVSFTYNEDMPPVIDDLSLHIKSGEYVAIVGSTGCGKSTLMRILLGFETPKRGDVYYDGKPISGLDLTSLRRCIGSVLQNGDVVTGSIYANIALSSSDISEDDAWEAAQKAGIADDIRKMPMQMNTVIDSGGMGISGGQKQRLLIARAIASKPKVILFDEATSALDNITQKNISDAVSEMNCTRIVIAHRLSTIIDCDRIICLDAGKIIEEGTYEQLMERGGFFAELVKRQQL